MMENKNNAAMNVNNLPYDIEENILSRVPVKTILRFMSVCKSWYSLFLDPLFINLHLKNNKNNTSNYNNVPLLMHMSEGRDQVVPILVVTDTSCVAYSRLILDPHLSAINIVGSCDGIVCVQGLHDRYRDQVCTEYIYVLNPALKFVKTIKKSEWYTGPGSIISQRILGFGFDSRSKDHKLIKFHKSDITVPKQVEIYSLSLDSWKTVIASDPHNVMDLFEGHRECISGVCINGVHHWPVMIPIKMADDKYTDHKAIISFDMGEEVFKKTIIPSKCMKMNNSHMMNCGIKLFNYNESLAVLSLDEDEFHYYIWVMNGYDTLEESWTELCKIDMVRVGPLYFRGFVHLRNEVIFSKLYFRRQIAFDMDKSEVDDSNSKADAYLQIYANQIMGIKESLLLLGSNN